jgi:predicted secreted hydrolase
MKTARFTVFVLVLGACNPRTRPAAETPRLSPTGVLSGGDAAGYARAEGPHAFAFPRDHGPHPSFRSEWWYFTGHLATRDGRRFGYQLTVFRQALAPAAIPRASAWATRQVYLGHLAISDLDGDRFAAYERTAREGLGLGGAEVSGDTVRVWVEDWRLAAEDGRQFHLRAHALPDGQAATIPATLDLVADLVGGRGPILQGENGLSQKGPEPGNASYYYSYTRIPTTGQLALGDQRFEVRGESWLDREWSTSALSPDVAGWDWLSLSLDDGRDVMVFRLRRRDGSAAPESRATLITDTGATPRTQLFAPGEASFSGLGHWTSAIGTSYPAGFRLQIPTARLDLEIRPLRADQELRLGFRYWEGAVEARGASGGRPLTGRGYLELTGYTR